MKGSGKDDDLQSSAFEINSVEDSRILRPYDASSSAGSVSLPLRTSESYENPVVASKEQRAVFLARVVVIMVLIIALILVTSIMYFVIVNNEREEFETQLKNYQSEISSAVQDNCQSAIDSAEVFSSMITSSAVDKGEEWPYVTISDFTSKAKRLSTLSGSYQIAFAPIVYANNITRWYNHSLNNLPAHYAEAMDVNGAIELNGDNKTVEQLMEETFAFPWIINQSDPFLGPLPIKADHPPPYLPELVGLRERIGFDGFFLNWQSLEQIKPLDAFFRVPTANLDLLSFGYEDSLATAYEFKIPAFDSHRDMILNLTATEIADPSDLVIGYNSQTQMVQPIFETIYNGHRSRKDLKMVGALVMLFDWNSLLSSLLSKADISDLEIVLSSTCSVKAQPVTFRLTDNGLVEMGKGDLHDRSYNEKGETYPLFELNLDEETQAAMDEVMAEEIEASLEGGCVSDVIMSIYPTKEFEQSFYTTTAWKLSAGVFGVFLFTSLVFYIYDVTVKRRQAKIMERVIRQDKIVLNTFPKAIRDKMYMISNQNRNGGDSDRYSSGSIRMENSIFGSGSLADLYPSATVVFADIVGFTAWSSAREPNQVFKLLETIYKEFDKLAYRHSIFKVETVGDCYVAVAGVPEKCDDHAVAVAKFARDCMHKMPNLVHKLEILLGPDTADLKLRIGINSGQVTAGVLRGDRARFQLFGDTVNTASRMETTSHAGRIQVSSSTADALRKFGRQRWLKPRKDLILVKGKGQMQTYYLETIEESFQRSKQHKCKSKPAEVSTLASSIITEESTDEDSIMSCADDEVSEDFAESQNMSKMDRLVEWNVEILGYLLKQIMVARTEHQQGGKESDLVKLEDEMRSRGAPPSIVLDEFKEIIELPTIGMDELLKRKHPDTITLKPAVVDQLRDLLKNIANMYNENPFHNFEHASHVTASVRKLLTRIVDADRYRSSSDIGSQSEHKMEDISGNSFGITSDPLTQFSVIFSAVIHDADHPGVPNTQLVKEETRLANLYKKSIAEQNSVALVWDLLMTPAYNDLRSCIYSNKEELKRFRQLVINTVMATDIVDKELQTLRKMRWEKAFSSAEELMADSTPRLDMNRKATIVIEHLIQASDVSHTMQHWKVYLQWNKNFFFELYDAFKNGRAETDPSIGWYKGEIGFFDFYIIPLAKKLESCGVFGVSSHEYLNYAQSNREQWVREGEEVVRQFMDDYNKARDPTL